MKNYLFNKVAVVAILSILVGASCSKLDEKLYGRVTPENFFQTDAEILSALAGVYNNMGFAVNGGNLWRLLHLGTDEFIIVARSDGRWLDGSVYIEFFEHKWTPINNRLTSYSDVFRTIGSANAVLEGMQSSPNVANLKAQIAEARGVRAYAYFYAMDLWGNVPLVTAAKVDPSNPPKTTSRADIFAFVEAEMLKAVNDLPSVTTVNRTAYYPRFTKEAVYGALAMVYLNGKVYTGKDYWTQSIEMCNKVTGSNAYILEPQFITNFYGDNDKSKELISSFSIDPAQTAGGNNYVRGALNALHVNSFNPVLPFVPANGFNTFEEALNRYEANDIRRKYIVWGPQVDYNGNPLKYTNGTPLVLVPIKDPTKAEDNEGYRVLKYIPDGKWVGRDAGNDIVLMRYADVLLMKAEALVRNGNAAEALPLINQVRARSNATPLASVTLQNLLDERGREFLWEGHRRRDLIRFGDYFTRTWTFNPVPVAAFRGLYPIPNQQIIANKNLTQNQGY